ncbi:HNH endonuclease signature motif containing protein [Hyphomonas sp.]|uniref:HNH endonuclease n=1 Tax=Hyphomonas sp. TaxID=87 RepID=UPI0025C44EAD|nr:HNH endonuclease signature motif containing protein [Hyphomonas sp.]
MTKTYRTQILRGGLNPKNYYLPVPKRMRDELPNSVFGGDGPANVADDVITLRVRGQDFETDIPKKHPTRFKSRSVAREIIDLLKLEAGDFLLFENVGHLAYDVKKESPGGAPGSGSETERKRKTTEERARRLASILARPQQAKFRQSVAARDGWICAITECVEQSALEAAHLHSVADGGNDDVANGMMLRADIHRLFDADLLTIDPTTGEVALSPDVKDDDYRELAGVIVSTGADLSNLKARYE